MRKANDPKRGAIVPLSGVLMVVLVVAAVFAAEIGRMGIIQAELQRTADAGALAACWELAQQFQDDAEVDDAAEAARTSAQDFVAQNIVRGVEPELDPNEDNEMAGDIVFGHFSDFGDASADMTPQIDANMNSVRVRVHKDAIRNGASSLGLARIFGVDSFGTSATATAAWVREIRGFEIPADPDETLGILPFAVKVTSWNSLLAGNGVDNWSWNPETKTVTSGGDGVLELNIYPINATPGNFGTVDVGSPNNSTDDLKRQINHGVSAEDLAYMGGKLELGEDGTILLNGDTGISASIGKELANVIGKPRIIMLYTTVSGNGNNAYFTIVKFVGIRIVEVKLTGNPKRILVQPAVVFSKSVIPNDGDDASDDVYSPVILVK
jgi:hypothetical protein